MSKKTEADRAYETYDKACKAYVKAYVKEKEACISAKEAGKAYIRAWGVYSEARDKAEEEEG